LLFYFLLPQLFFTGLVTPILFFLIHIGYLSLLGHHEMSMIERG
jgi:hypothetical protein